MFFLFQFFTGETIAEYPISRSGTARATQQPAVAHVRPPSAFSSHANGQDSNFSGIKELLLSASSINRRQGFEALREIESNARKFTFQKVGENPGRGRASSRSEETMNEDYAKNLREGTAIMRQSIEMLVSVVLESEDISARMDALRELSGMPLSLSRIICESQDANVRMRALEYLFAYRHTARSLGNSILLELCKNCAHQDVKEFLSSNGFDAKGQDDRA